jgi:hypothetical protein
VGGSVRHKASPNGNASVPAWRFGAHCGGYEGEERVSSRVVPRHAQPPAAGRWAGRIAGYGSALRSLTQHMVRGQPARCDPLLEPVAITEHCVIGDQIRVPAAWCDMGCGRQFADPAALGEADNRARALAAGAGHPGRSCLPRSRVTAMGGQHPNEQLHRSDGKEPGGAVDVAACVLVRHTGHQRGRNPGSVAMADTADTWLPQQRPSREEASPFSSRGRPFLSYGEYRPAPIGQPAWGVTGSRAVAFRGGDDLHRYERGLA